MQGGAIRVHPPSQPRDLELGEPRVGGGGALGLRLAWTRSTQAAELKEWYGKSLTFQVLAPSSVPQPGVIGLAHVHLWTPVPKELYRSGAGAGTQSVSLRDYGYRLSE